MLLMMLDWYSPVLGAEFSEWWPLKLQGFSGL